MTEEEFIRLVKQAEDQVGTHAGRYKLKLALFALLGYVVIFALLGGLVAIVGGAIAATAYSTAAILLLLKSKLLAPALIMAWVLLKALWVRFEKPQGYELKRSDFPELYRELDGLRAALRSLPIHRVLLTPELNAAVVQTPRLGLFGWQHNTLILGLELLLILSPEQARAVLAHELGHLSKNHSRFGGWIYRVRTTWYRVMEAFHGTDNLGARMLRKFFDWYAPNFYAYSFALARSNEYEADAVSARLTSPDTALLALVNTYVTAPYVNESYWSWYFRKADTMPQPDQPPYSGLTQFLNARPQSRRDILDRIREAMSRETAYDDTHPALKDRIAALGGKPDVPRPAGTDNAAAAWLGARCAQAITAFDERWLAENQEKWHERYEYVQNATGQLTGLEQRPLDELAEEEHWNLAAWTEEFRPERDPLPLYQAYQQRFPQEPAAAFVIGRLLAERGDDACLDQLDRAAAHPQITVRACQIAYNFLQEQQRHEQAEHWRQRALERIELNERAEAERQSVSVKDTLLTPEIPAEILAELKEQLLRSGRVRRAWLAQKQVEHDPEDPVYVVAFKSRGFLWSCNGAVDRLLQHLHLRLPVTMFFVAYCGDYRKLSRRVVKAGIRIV